MLFEKWTIMPAPQECLRNRVHLRFSPCVGLENCFWIEGTSDLYCLGWDDEFPKSHQLPVFRNSLSCCSRIADQTCTHILFVGSSAVNARCRTNRYFRPVPTAKTSAAPFASCSRTATGA